MTIEVHQLLILSRVDGDDTAGRDTPPPPDLDELREQLLAQCKAWLLERLQDSRER